MVGPFRSVPVFQRVVTRSSAVVRVGLWRVVPLFLLTSVGGIGLVPGAATPAAVHAESVAARPSIAQADTTATISIQPTVTSLAPGDTTSVALQATVLDVGIGSWVIDVTYDPSMVQAVTCDQSGGSICNTSVAPNTIRVVGASLSGQTGNQTLVNITFQAVGPAGGVSPLSLTVGSLTDPNGNDLSSTSTGGEIDIAAS
ncbi:MAG: cohesin domain-containing protein [Dehalococcoidia bacterium]